MKNIKAVIFDLDNTLVNRKKAFYHFSKSFINEHFLDHDLPDTIDNMLEYMLLLDNNGYRNIYDFYENIISKWNIQGCTARQLTDNHASSFCKFTTLDTDTIKALDYLCPKYKLGIITNGSSKAQNGKIDHVHLRNRFESIIVSEDVGLKKPDKQIFELSCKSLNVQNKEAVYIGDQYELDVTGALNAGLHAIWYVGNSKCHVSYEPTIRNLSKIISLL